MKLGAKGKNLLGIFMLLGATILWGTAFVVLKNTVEDLPVLYVLTLRFLPSGVIMMLLCAKKWRQIDKTIVLRGMLLGAFVFAAYTLQTYGLRYTTPAHNAFITVSYCVMTPFMMWALFRQRPHAYNLISAAVCIVGLALLSLVGQAGDGIYLLGDGLTLACAVGFAFQIIYIDRFQQKGADPMLLLGIELLTAGLLCALAFLAVDVPRLGAAAFAIPTQHIWRLVYLSLLCSLVAQMLQMVGQRFSTPNQTSIVLGFESVVGAVASLIAGTEKATVAMAFGCVLIFAAIIISECHLDPIVLVRRLRARRMTSTVLPSTSPAEPTDSDVAPDSSPAEPCASADAAPTDSQDPSALDK